MKKLIEQSEVQKHLRACNFGRFVIFSQWLFNAHKRMHRFVTIFNQTPFNPFYAGELHGRATFYDWHEKSWCHLESICQLWHDFLVFRHPLWPNMFSMADLLIYITDFKWKGSLCQKTHVKYLMPCSFKRNNWGVRDHLHNGFFSSGTPVLKQDWHAKGMFYYIHGWTCLNSLLVKTIQFSKV